MAAGEDILGNSGLPLCFPLKKTKTHKLPLPENRLGEAVRVAVRSLSVMQKEAVVVSARTGQAWRLASDEGAYLDGHDQAPCPLSFLSTGMVSSYMNEVLALAERRGIVIRQTRLVLDNFYTMKGSAIRGSMRGGAKDVELQAQIDSDADAATLQGLVCDAVAASPLNGLLRGHKDSLFALAHNGTQIKTARALNIAGDMMADPGDVFAGIGPAAGDWGETVKRLDRMTPENENTKTFASGSLADRQDRLLHVRVHCTLLRDGQKEIVQYLYNPHGSVFRFRSDEVGADGTSRAPDALSYAAAGIGFCFMTQFGRYAKIVRKPLSEYRIVQDLHTSRGGASGDTGSAGAADPVETHVYLFSEQNDVFARQALDMAEQTCFLHALCKADLKARVRISGYDATLTP